MCYYEIRKADPGEYEVQIRLNEARPPAAGEVSAEVKVIRHAGTANERVYEQTVVLNKVGARVGVVKVKF
jgi:hypothetical protein